MHIYDDPANCTTFADFLSEYSPLLFPPKQIGRLRRNKPPRAYSSSHGMKGAGGSFNANVAAGRLLCDTYLSAKEFLRETTYRSAPFAFWIFYDFFDRKRSNLAAYLCRLA